MRFRKKPVEIEAVQWTGYNAPALKLFAGKNRADGRNCQHEHNGNAWFHS